MADLQPSRRSRGFSVKSDKSHNSGNSGHRSQLSESSAEKRRRNLHTKADPTVAMNELQPSMCFFPLNFKWPRGRIPPISLIMKLTDTLQWLSPWKSPIWALFVKWNTRINSATLSVRTPRHSCSRSPLVFTDASALIQLIPTGQTQPDLALSDRSIPSNHSKPLSTVPTAVIAIPTSKQVRPNVPTPYHTILTSNR